LPVPRAWAIRATEPANATAPAAVATFFSSLPLSFFDAVILKISFVRYI
jgi:hypothetical protein